MVGNGRNSIELFPSDMTAEILINSILSTFWTDNCKQTEYPVCQKPSKLGKHYKK